MIEDELTIEQIKKMSQNELFVWGEVFAKEQQAKQIRKVLLNHIEEIQESKVIS